MVDGVGGWVGGKRHTGRVVLEDVLDGVKRQEDLGGATALGHLQEEAERGANHLLVVAPVLEVVAHLFSGKVGVGGWLSMMKREGAARPPACTVAHSNRLFFLHPTNPHPPTLVTMILVTAMGSPSPMSSYIA